MPAAKMMRGDAIHGLYSDHHGWLYDWLRRRLGCAHKAADLAHDTFVRLLVSHHPSALHHPRAYLRTVAQGLVVDHWRRQQLEQAYLETVAVLSERQVPPPDARLLVIEALLRIDALLDGLQPRARKAFLLSRLEGLCYPEIAAQMCVSLSSVEKYMSAAIRHCLAVRQAV